MKSSGPLAAECIIDLVEEIRKLKRERKNANELPK